MDEIAARMRNCFKTAFPNIAEGDIATASQASVAAWDSTGAIMLANVVEDEFGIQIDFDLLPDLNTFDRMCDYVRDAGRKQAGA